MLKYLLRYRPQKMGEELEEMKKLADQGQQKHSLDEGMRGVQEEAYRAYLMQAVREPEGVVEQSSSRARGRMNPFLNLIVASN